MVTSPFSSRVRRPILPPIGLQSVFREVRTEDELRQALTPLAPPKTVAEFIANTGRRIVIAGPITLKAPIIISSTIPGVTIESHGSVPIYCGVDGIDAFIIRAQLTSIRGLLLSGDATNNRRWNRGFVFEGDDSGLGSIGDPGFCRILDCTVSGANQMVGDDSSGGASSAIVDRCVFSRFADDVNYDGIACNSQNWRITSNRVTGQGTGVAISVGAIGRYTAIVGNNCLDDGITTSASAGSNTISANTRAGTVTAHATDDALGGNT